MQCNYNSSEGLHQGVLYENYKLHINLIWKIIF